MSRPRRSLVLLASVATIAGLTVGGAVATEPAPVSGRLVTFTSEVSGEPDQKAVLTDEGLVPVTQPQASRIEAGTRYRSKAATTAAVKPKAHKIYIAVVDNTGPLPADDDTDAEITETVQDAGDYWVRELGRLIPSFQVVQIVHVNSARTDCDSAYDMIDAANAALPAAAQAAGAHVVVLTPKSCVLAPSAGVAYRGGTSLHSGGGSISSMSSYLTATVAHELGHNLGINHANLDQCPTTAPPCPSIEYGDRTSIMGQGGVSGAIPVLGAVFRRITGIELDDEVAELVVPATSPRTTTLTLRPRTDGSGRRAIHVTDPVDGGSYFIEYRSGKGTDAGEYDTGYNQNGITYVTGVVVTRAGADATSRLQTRHAGSSWYSAFVKGSTFTSPSKTLKVAVTATGTNATVKVTLASLKKFKAPTPTISGTAKVGRTLTAKVGTWSPKPRFSYQWYFDGTAYPGATRSTFVVDSFVQTRKITVKVTGYKPGYVKASRTSKATKAVVK